MAFMSPSFFVLYSAHNSVMISGESDTGTSIANIPSETRVNNPSTWMMNVLTTPSPTQVFDDGGRNIRPDESIDQERRGNKRHYESSPFKGCNVGNHDLSKNLQPATDVV